MSSVWMQHDWNKCRSLNVWDVFWMNQEKMLPHGIGRWRVGGKLQIPG